VLCIPLGNPNNTNKSYQIETIRNERTPLKPKIEKLRKTAEIAASHLFGLINTQVARGLTSRDASLKNYSVANFDLVKRKPPVDSQLESKKRKK